MGPLSSNAPSYTTSSLSYTLLTARELRGELATYDDAVVMQLCSGVFEGNNDYKKDEMSDSKNNQRNGRKSRKNDNDDDNGGTLAVGNTHNGAILPLNLPSQHMTHPLNTPPNKMIHPLTPPFLKTIIVFAISRRTGNHYSQEALDKFDDKCVTR